MYLDKIDADTKKDNEESMKNILVAFGQNQYAQSGYPADIGEINSYYLHSVLKCWRCYWKSICST